MKIVCVVLNYNDAGTAIEQLDRLKSYRCLDGIVAVDNCSTDGSMEELLRWKEGCSTCGPQIMVVQSGRNGGYGAGNNFGIRCAAEDLRATHVVVANPDAIFSEECVKAMARVFQRHGQVAVAAPHMESGAGKNQEAAWRLRPFWSDLLSMGPVSRRVLKRRLFYPEEKFAGRKAVPVDVVHGSLLMIDVRKMKEAGGYDEGVFLYEEEKILAWRMRRKGYRTVFLPQQTYRHKNSASISKTYDSAAGRQRLRHESALYYYRNYLNISKPQELAAKLFFQIILLEIWFCTAILKMKL